MSETLDAVDAKILDLIQHDAGLSVAEIADRVGLSSSPCWRRIKRLEDAGVIQRRVTILDRDKLGLGFEVYCTVKLSLPTKDNLDAFETAITTLVQQAPDLDPALIASLVDELRAVGSPLALSIARVVELVGEGLVDPGIALPALAMACATLADGCRGRLGARALEAARFEIETLLPVPDRAPKLAAPDVPVSSLRRR